MAATFRYYDRRRETVAGEIWCPGPRHKTLWVLGPDGPTVVNLDTRTEVPYDWPHFHFDERGIGGWSYNEHFAPASNMGPLRSEKLRYGRAPVPAKQWSALIDGAFEVQPEPIAGTDLIPSWELPLELPSAA